MNKNIECRTRNDDIVEAVMKTVLDIMTQKLLTTTHDTTLVDAHKIMEDNQIHHVLVVDDKEKLVGILSDRDIKKFASPFAGSQLEASKDKATLSLPVEKIMSKNVTTISPQKTIKACINKLIEHCIHSLPVIDDNGKLIGIVTSRNIFEHVLEVIL